MHKTAFSYLFSCLIVLASCGKTNSPPSDGGIKNPPVEQPKNNTPTTYVPGESYKFYLTNADGSTSTDIGVVYIAGDKDSKLIITAPHGGKTKPSYVRSRTADYSYGNLITDPYNNDKSFSETEDLNTKDFAETIATAIKAKTGLRPHLIVNNLHRSKLDANRRMEVAAQGDRNAENTWKAFQKYIDDARQTVNTNHSAGLLIDIHGNGHTPQRTEVGYLISKDDFKSNIESQVNNTSIKSMVNANNTLTALIFGEYALGTLLNNKLDVIVTPSKLHTDPASFSDGLYFEGGYITARHGSKQGGKIAAIQLEFNSNVRANDTTRPTYAGLVADALKIYLDKYFN